MLIDNNNQLSWKNHINFLHNKLSKVCSMISKLRHYVPLSTHIGILQHVQLHLQYSLLIWGRATKTQYHKLIILQNKIIRACLFCPQHYKTDLLYSRFKVLKLDDMITIEYAKLNTTTTCYCIHLIITLPNLNSTKYYTMQNHRQECNREKSSSSYWLKFLEKYSPNYGRCSLSEFIRYFKNNILANY